MQNKRTFQPAEVIVLGFVLGAAAVLWSWFDRVTALTLEDALITFRYAENLATGNGLVFNVGERVLGTTTPLFAILLGLLGALFGPDRIPSLASILLIVFSIGMGIFVYLILKRSGFPWPWAMLGMSIVLFHPDITWVTAGGMETPLVLLLMAISLYGLCRRSWVTVGIFTGLLVLTRPDGYLWTTALLTAAWLRDRKDLAPILAAHLAVVTPWVVFALLYYGNPVPHSLLAKLSIPMETGPTPGLLDGWPLYSVWFRDGIGIAMRGRAASIEFVEFVLWAGLLFTGVVSVARRGIRDPLMVLILFPLLFAAAFLLGRAPMAFPWYLVPFTWVCLLVVAIGVVSLSRDLVRWTRGRRGLRVVCLVLGLAVTLILTDRLIDDHRESLRVQRQSQDYEMASRHKIGLWLRNNTGPDATVAMEAIGYQGALSRRRVIDLAGLISPGVVSIAADCFTNGEFYYRVLSELKPDYLVLRATEIERNEHFFGGATFDNDEQRGYFDENYELVESFTGPTVWEPAARLLIFRRADSRGPAE